MIKIDMVNFAKTPQRIIEEGTTFSIPIYQRLFTWTPDEINTLLEDLYDQFLKDKNEHYYIGLLTSTNRNELVDGQQRFTVATLFALVMREKYDKWGDFLKKDGEQRLTFIARKDDEKYLRSKIENSSDDHIVINNYMEAGIMAITDYLSNLKKQNTGDNNDVEFSKYVFEHLAFFIQKLPKGYSGRMLNKYFEAMNSTGRNLESHEILKVELLERAQTTESQDRYDNDTLVTMWNMSSRMNQTMFPFYDDKTRNEYQARIKQIQSKSYKFIKLETEQEKSRTILDVLKNPPTKRLSSDGKATGTMRSFLKFTDLLLQVLYIMLEEQNIYIPNKQKFFRPENLRNTFFEYQAYYRPEDFIKTLFLYRIILDWAVIRIDGEGDYDLAMTQKELSHLQQFEAMLFANSSRDTYYLWLPFLLKLVKEKECDEDFLLNQLKQRDNSVHKISSQELSYRNFDNYVFRRLDYYLWEEFMSDNSVNSDFICRDLSTDELKELKRAVSSYKFHQYNSVEHLHPQDESKQVEKWKKSNDDLDGSMTLNGFGNLALISSVFNSSQNNDSLNPKFGRIRDQISQKKLESIKLAIMYYEANGKSEMWTKEISKKHGEKMIEFLNKTYE